VARVISTYHLSSRLSDRLVDAFLEAEDMDQQQHILAHPEHIIWDQKDLPEDPYDSKLSLYGNEVMHSIMNLLQSLDTILSCLDDRRIREIDESEKIMIIPFLQELSGPIEKLSESIIEIHPPQQSR
jgi:hypothetical protein